MGVRGTLLGLVFMAALLGTPGAALAEDWAALDAHNTGTGPVVWGSDKEQTRARAVAACRRVSDTCSGGAAWTNDLESVFVYMCCTRPRLACTIGTGDTKPDAVALASKLFSDNGFTACTVRNYLSARTGNKM